MLGSIKRKLHQAGRNYRMMKNFVNLYLIMSGFSFVHRNLQHIPIFNVYADFRCNSIKGSMMFMKNTGMLHVEE